MNNNAFFLKRCDEYESSARSYSRKFPIAIKKAKGVIIEDVEGKEYIDFLCGAGTLALGHNDSEVNKALIDYIQSDSPLHTLDLITPAKDEFVHTLFSCFPEEFRKDAKVQFCAPAGTDAIDAAIKLCRIATGRRTVISFSGGYHGMGQGPLTLMGNLHAKSNINGLSSDVQFFPYPYEYRPAFGVKGSEGVKIACSYFERMLKDPESGITAPACVVLEAIQGEGGVIPAPSEFLQTVRRVTKELGIPLILDEVQAGIGRSGDFFAFEESGIIPDVIAISKAVGGSLPMAVMAYNKNLDKWDAGTHAGTFRGTTLAMVGGNVLLNRVKQPSFLSEVKRKGNIFKTHFEDLKKECAVIGDVRGRGMMLGIEIVDPKSEEDMCGAKKGSGTIAAELQRLCFENGLIMEKGGRNGAVMRCLTALSIDDSNLNKGIDILSDCIRKINKKYS